MNLQRINPIVPPQAGTEPDTLDPAELEAAPDVEQPDDTEAEDKPDEPAPAPLAWPFNARAAQRAELYRGVRAQERRLQERRGLVSALEALLVTQPEDESTARKLDAATANVSTAERTLAALEAQVADFDARTEAMRPELEALARDAAQAREFDGFDLAPVIAAVHAIGAQVEAARKADQEVSPRWNPIASRATALGLPPPQRAEANALQRVEQAIVATLFPYRVDTRKLYIYR